MVLHLNVSHLTIVPICQTVYFQILPRDHGASEVWKLKRGMKSLYIFSAAVAPDFFRVGYACVYLVK